MDKWSSLHARDHACRKGEYEASRSHHGEQDVELDDFYGSDGSIIRGHHKGAR